MGDAPRGFAVGPGEAERSRTIIGGDVTFLLRSEQAGGALIALEVLVPPGEGPPLHVHTREEETIYMLEGDFRWKIDGELSSTPPGSFVFIPRGMPHCFQNIGGQDGRLLITFAPGGMEGFFDELAEHTEFDLQAFKAAAAKQGMEVVGPPLAESEPL